MSDAVSNVDRRIFDMNSLVPRRFAGALLLLALLFATPAALGQSAKVEDWVRTLSGDRTESESDTGVVGMSASEAEALAAAEEEEEDDEEVAEDFIRNRRRLVFREMKFASDWDTDPTAMTAMIYQFKRRTGMDSYALQPRRPLTFDDPDLLHWPLVFMTAHNAFTLSKKEILGLRRYLQNGGFLFADDCLYGFPFGPAFHSELMKVLPGTEFKELRPDQPVFSMMLKQKYTWPETNEAGLPGSLKANPFEYMLVDGRIGVLYTTPDLGCMWEISSPPTPSNPLGTGMHNWDRIPGLREDAYRISVNILLYSMIH